MKKLLSLIIAVFVSLPTFASEYGHYDIQHLLRVSETPAGNKYGFDSEYFNKILTDLSSHAQSYPPKFDNPQDQQRAIQDVQKLSGMLDILLQGPTGTPELLIRAAYLNSMGHNLDIPGSAQKADDLFKKYLAEKSSDPRANYLYGNFLAGAGKTKEALPYLEKAYQAGMADAPYSLGIAHLTLGDKEKALKYLEEYKKHQPNNKEIDSLIDAIRQEKVKVHNS